MDAMGKDWPKWGCKHADDMEDLEYIFGRTCKERERNDWIAEVKKLKQQHANECVKQGIAEQELATQNLVSQGLGSLELDAYETDERARIFV
jgi:hypothetical protein